MSVLRDGQPRATVMGVLQQGEVLERMAEGLGLHRNELQKLSVAQYNALCALWAAAGPTDPRLLQAASIYKLEQLQSIAQEEHIMVGTKTHLSELMRLLHKLGYDKMPAATQQLIMTGLGREHTGIIDLRLFLRLWRVWNKKSEELPPPASPVVECDLQSALQKWPGAAEPLSTIAKHEEIKRVCLESADKDGHVTQETFALILRHHGVHLTLAQLDSLWHVLESQHIKDERMICCGELFEFVKSFEGEYSQSKRNHRSQGRPVSPVKSSLPMSMMARISDVWGVVREKIMTQGSFSPDKGILIRELRNAGVILSYDDSCALWKYLGADNRDSLPLAQIDELLGIQTSDSVGNPAHKSAAQTPFATSTQPHVSTSRLSTHRKFFPQRETSNLIRPQTAPAGRESFSTLRDAQNTAGGLPNSVLRIERMFKALPDNQMRRLNAYVNRLGGYDEVASPNALQSLVASLGLSLNPGGAEEAFDTISVKLQKDAHSSNPRNITWRELLKLFGFDSATLDSLTVAALGAEGLGNERGEEQLEQSVHCESLESLSPSRSRHSLNPSPIRTARERLFALQALQENRPAFAMLMRAAGDQHGKVERSALASIFSHPRLHIRDHISEEAAEHLANEIVDSSPNGIAVDFTHVMRFISRTLNHPGVAGETDTMKKSDSVLSISLKNKLRRSNILKGDVATLVGWYPRLQHRLRSMCERGTVVSWDPQGADLCMVSTLPEIFRLVDVEMTRDEAGYVLKKALEASERLDPGMGKDKTSQSVAPSLAACVKVMLDLLH